MILTLEQMVVSLKLAKRMKELGFSQETLFHWCDNEIKSEMNSHGLTMRCDLMRDRYHIAAPMSNEIGELLKEQYGQTLPRYYKSKGFIVVEKDIWDEPTMRYSTQLKAKTEAEARGLMWCWLNEKIRS